MTHQESSNGLKLAFEQPLIKFLMSFENIMYETYFEQYWVSFGQFKCRLSSLGVQGLFRPLRPLYVASKFPLEKYP